jgi:beta-lactamase regulating signal transducer with metallopeptidase domain
MSPLFTMLLWNTSLAGGLALVVYLAQRFQWPKCHPSLWYVLWLLVLLKLIVPPVFTFPVALQTSSQAIEPNDGAVAMNLGREFSLVSQDDAEGEARSVTAWIPQLAIALSVVGTIAVLVLSLIRNRRIASLVRLANPGPAQLQELTESLAREIGIGRPVTLLGVDGCVSPFLYVRKQGLVILAPSELIARFERDSLRLIIKHELMHYARRDHWTNVFSTLVVAILWWNPVAWWARREMRFVQELCCDAAVLLSDNGQRRRYAETLLQTVDFVASDDATLPAPATAFGSCKTFKRRIEMISRKDLSSRAPVVTRLLILTMGASPGSFFTMVARRELMVISGVLPTWLRKFRSIAISVIFL